MSDDTNTKLIEEAIELADILGQDYAEEVGRLVNANDLRTLAIFKRDMERVIKIYDQDTDNGAAEGRTREGAGSEVA